MRRQSVIAAAQPKKKLGAMAGFGPIFMQKKPLPNGQKLT
jgi:hypothetical protein